MRSPGAFTIGLIIHLLTANHPKIIRRKNALLTPKWSAWRDKSSASCCQTSRNVIAIFDYDCTKCIAHSGVNPTSCFGTSEDEPPQSLALLTPKWSTRPGERSTSCFKALVKPVCNLRISNHKMLIQPGS